MALWKIVENSMGVTGNYWRVMPQIIVDFEGGTAKGMLMVWANDKTRRNGKNPLHLHDFMTPQMARAVEDALQLSGEEFKEALVTGDLRAALYTKLRALPFFSGAHQV